MMKANSDNIRKRARNFALNASLLGIGLTMGALSASGQDAADPRAGEVAVGGKTILTIRVPSEGMTVRERAEAISNRLVTILSDPNLKPADIQAVPLGRNAAKIMVKNQLLVTVDSQTARINQAKPMALAQIWVDHLRRVLPRVNVKPNPNNGEPPHNNDSDAAGSQGGGSPK